jgi:primosomal protein N'
VRSLFSDGLGIVELPDPPPQSPPNPATPPQILSESEDRPKKLLLKDSPSRKIRSTHPEADHEYMDASQQGAINKALDRGAPVTVIQGPPGTGKTVVVCEIIAKAVARGERVLATAPTNAAVDNMVRDSGGFEE